LDFVYETIKLVLTAINMTGGWPWEPHIHVIE